MEKSQLEQASMMIIMYAGTAKSDALDAMDLAIEGNYNDAYELIKSSEENLRLSNKEHFSVLQHDASGEVKMNILFIHAEDQMMAAETIITIVKKMMMLTKKLR